MNDINVSSDNSLRLKIVIDTIFAPLATYPGVLDTSKSSDCQHIAQTSI